MAGFQDLPPEIARGVLRVATIGDLPTAANGAVKGDIRYVDANDEIYSFDGTTWQQVSGAAGTVTGPGASTDNAIARFDGTGGAALQNSVVTISDTGVITGATIAVASVTGAVEGPASATDNAIARFDGTTGKLIQNSTSTLNDLGGLNIIGGTTGDGYIDFVNSVSVGAAPPAGHTRILGALDGLAIYGENGFFSAISNTMLTANRVLYLPDTPGGLGNIVGSDLVATTDNAIARWDGVSGRLIQNSAVTVSDAGLLSSTSMAVPTFTAGSMVFAATGGVFAQDNANFFWDDTNNRLGIGTAAPAFTLDLVGEFHITMAGVERFRINATTLSLGIGNASASAAGGERNTAVGFDALSAVTTGDDNSAFGYQAGNTITTGSNIVVIGSLADVAATTDNQSVAVGYNSSVGNGAVSIGFGAKATGNSVVIGNTAGSAAANTRQVLIGESTGASLNATAFANTIVGTQAGILVTSASGSAFFGRRAGDSVTTGGNNTILGVDADVTVGTITNSAAIGANASVSASNTMVLGNSSVVLVTTAGVVESTVGGFKFPDATTQTTAASSLVFASGVYTPTLTDVNGNLDSETAFQCQYMRVGSVVTVSGKVSVNPTTPTTSIQLGISLPIASNIGAEEDVGGTACATGIAGMSAGILGDAANDRAQLQFISTDITDQPMFFSFTYRII